MIRRGVPHVVKTTRTPSVSSLFMVGVVVVVVGELPSRYNIIFGYATPDDDDEPRARVGAG